MNNPGDSRARDGQTESDPPIPEAIRRVQRPLHSIPLPPELDAKTLALIRQAAAGQSAPVELNDARRRAGNRRALLWSGAAAASALFALGLAWYALRDGGATIAGEILRSRGEVQRDGRALPAPESTGAALAAGESYELGPEALIYLKLAPGLVVRVLGPAKFQVRGAGLALDHGRLALLANDERLSADQRAEHHKVHAAFRIATPRAEYRLLGTMAALHVQTGARRAELLRVLEGALAVRMYNASADLRADAGRAFDAIDQRLFALAANERTDLERIRASLETPDAPVGLNLEEIRAVYGSVSEFTLRDGRVLQGFLVRTEAGETLQTPAGPVPVEPTDIVSFTLLDSP